MKTYNTRIDCYLALMEQAKAEGAKETRMIAPNTGSERTIEIPEGLHGMGLEITTIATNDKGNHVVRTKTIYGLFADYADWY